MPNRERQILKIVSFRPRIDQIIAQNSEKQYKTWFIKAVFALSLRCLHILELIVRRCRLRYCCLRQNMANIQSKIDPNCYLCQNRAKVQSQMQSKTVDFILKRGGFAFHQQQQSMVLRISIQISIQMTVFNTNHAILHDPPESHLHLLLFGHFLRAGLVSEVSPTELWAHCSCIRITIDSYLRCADIMCRSDCIHLHRKRQCSITSAITKLNHG